MLTPGMVGSLPFRVDNWPLSNFDYAIAGTETDASRGSDQIYVGPLVSVVVDVVSDLAEQNALDLQDPIGLSQKRRVGVGEAVRVLFGRSHHEAEARVEVFGLVLALVRYVRWVINHDIENSIMERHTSIVAHDPGAMLHLNVHSHNWTITSSPKPSTVHRRIEDLLWGLPGIKVKHSIQEFGVFSIPYGSQRSVPGLPTRSGLLLLCGGLVCGCFRNGQRLGIERQLVQNPMLCASSVNPGYRLGASRIWPDKTADTPV